MSWSNTASTGLSKCHRAAVFVVGGKPDLGHMVTMHYECSWCEKPCDIWEGSIMKKQKMAKSFYLSSSGFETIEEAIELWKQYKDNGDLKHGTVIIEAKRVFTPVENIELKEL
jgi:hypothetical protein